MNINEIVILNEGLYDPNIFKIIAMIGPMGAGKTSVAKKLVGGTGLRNLNLDTFNELMIKKGLVPGGRLQPEHLNKSWHLTQKQKENWIDGRLGMVIDGSGRNVSRLVQPLKKLERLGYDVAVVLVNTSLETSIERQQKREQEQIQKYGVGRSVPPELAKSSYEKIQSNIPRYKHIFDENFFIINNDSENSEEYAKVEKSIRQFLNTPPSKPAALGWIKQQQRNRTSRNA